jgi:hypothetical protein
MHKVYKLSTQKARHASWLQLTQEWRESGMSAKHFCEQVGIRLADLRRWSYRLNKGKPDQSQSDTREKQKPSFEFIPLQLENLNPRVSRKNHAIELLIGANYRLQCHQDFDEALLVRLLTTLQRM